MAHCSGRDEEWSEAEARTLRRCTWLAVAAGAIGTPLLMLGWWGIGSALDGHGPAAAETAACRSAIMPDPALAAAPPAPAGFAGDAGPRHL